MADRPYRADRHAVAVERGQHDLVDLRLCLSSRRELRDYVAKDEDLVVLENLPARARRTRHGAVDERRPGARHRGPDELVGFTVEQADTRRVRAASLQGKLAKKIEHIGRPP